MDHWFVQMRSGFELMTEKGVGMFGETNDDKKEKEDDRPEDIL